MRHTPPRLAALLLAPFTLVLGVWFLSGWYAATPAGAQKPKQEEQEEGDEPAKPATKGKVPKREEVEEGDPQADETHPVDLAQEIKNSRGDIRDLFVLLLTPHDDIVTTVTGVVHHVEPLAQYVGANPSFTRKLVPVKIDKDGKRRRMQPMASKHIKEVVSYEEIALRAVDRLLATRDEARLLAAEKALNAALRFHFTKRERRSEDAAAWTAEATRLRARLLAIRRDQVNLLATAKQWDKAFRLAEQLARENVENADVQIDLVRLALRRAHDSNRLADFVAARNRLLAAEVQFGYANALEEVRKSLIAKAQRLLAEGNALAETDRAAAVDKLRSASQVWPQLPELQEKLRELDREHPVLYVGVRTLPVYLSPATAWTDSEKQAVELLFEGLVQGSFEDGTWHYRPVLSVGRPRVIPLGRQFELVPDAEWSDGKQVTAADIRHTVQLLKRPKLPGRNPEWARLVEDPRVEGSPRQVRITLRSGFLDPLSLMTFKILPRQFQGQPLRDADDETFGKNPVGSGPFRYQDTTNEGESPQAVFVANPSYQRAGRPGLPRIKEIRFVVPRDPVADFKAGRIHLLLDMPTERVGELIKAGVREADIRTLANRRVYFLAVNHENEALQSLDLRKALAHAIDREALLKEFFRGGFEAIDAQHRLVAKAAADTKPLHPALNGPYPLDSWACAPASRVPRNLYDLDKARTRAKQARLDRVELTLKYPNDDPRVSKACQAMADQLSKLPGLKVTAVGLSLRDFRDAIMRRKYDLAYCHYDYDSAAYWLWPLFDPDESARAAGGSNYLRYGDDDDLARYFRLAMSYRNFDDVRKQTHDIHAHLFDKMPLIPLWQLHTHTAVSPDLATAGVDPLRVFSNVEEWRLEKK
jgi:ABC-type transport system substrate-binding protein